MTEFLPISSSGHLVFFQSYFGLKEPRLFFDVMLHFGTLLAIIVYFRRDLLGILRDMASSATGRKNGEGIKCLFWILVATIPTGLIGFLLKNWLESLFTQPKTVGAMLIVTGTLLFLTRWAKKEGRHLEQMEWRDALLIGLAQGIAIIPGISRSGATIATALFCGLNREWAGRFSFLLSIPAILGATLLELYQVNSTTELQAVSIGTVIAFLSGLLSLAFLMKVIQKGKLFHFSYYCWAMGGVMVLFAVR